MKTQTILIIALFIGSFAFGAACPVDANGGIHVLLLADDYGGSTTTVRGYLSGYSEISYIGEYNYATNSTLPTLSELLAYDVVLTWTNFDPPASFGDLISDYIDAGGAVVVMAFSDSAGWDLGGRYISTHKNLLAPTNYHHVSDSFGTVDIPGHPIMAGVLSLNTNYHAIQSTTVNGGIVIARYNGGDVLVAVSPVCNLVTLNFFPQFGWSGDGGILMRNALVYASQYSVSIPVGMKVPGTSAPELQYALTNGFTFSNFVNVLSSKPNAYVPTGVAITGIAITSSRSFQNVQLLIDETNENPIYPVPVPLDGVQVYKYEKVVLGMPKASIEGVEFTFKVDLAWFGAMGVVKGEVAMFQFNGTEWVELPTTMLYEDSSFAYYSSESAGLGYLAIAG